MPPSHTYAPPHSQVLNDEEHWEKLRSFTPKLLPYTSIEKLQQVHIVGAHRLTLPGCIYLCKCSVQCV